MWSSVTAPRWPVAAARHAHMLAPPPSLPVSPGQRVDQSPSLCRGQAPRPDQARGSDPGGAHPPRSRTRSSVNGMLSSRRRLKTGPQCASPWRRGSTPSLSWCGPARLRRMCCQLICSCPVRGSKARSKAAVQASQRVQPGREPHFPSRWCESADEKRRSAALRRPRA